MDATRTVLILSALLVASGASAQTTQAEPPAPIEPPADTSPVPRATLLREGSRIVMHEAGRWVAPNG